MLDVPKDFYRQVSLYFYEEDFKVLTIHVEKVLTPKPLFFEEKPTNNNFYKNKSFMFLIQNLETIFHKISDLTFRKNYFGEIMKIGVIINNFFFKSFCIQTFERC